MDDEIAGMCRRLAQGLEVNEATIAVELVREIGPRGTGYLTAPHTLERLRSRRVLRSETGGAGLAGRLGGGREQRHLRAGTREGPGTGRESHRRVGCKAPRATEGRSFAQ